jgi:hypothetical protein
VHVPDPSSFGSGPSCRHSCISVSAALRSDTLPGTGMARRLRRGALLTRNRRQRRNSWEGIQEREIELYSKRWNDTISNCRSDFLTEGCWATSKLPWLMCWITAGQRSRRVPAGACTHAVHYTASSGDYHGGVHRMLYSAVQSSVNESFAQDFASG